LLSAFQQDKNCCEPHWQVAGLPMLNGINPGIATWLFNLDSLTARLKIGCLPDTFKVKVKQQHYRYAYPSESRALGIASRQVCFIREVHLYCGSRPVVFARTCMPLKALTGKYQRFSGLGRKPLGEVLFSDPLITRGQIEVAIFTCANVIYTRALQPIKARPPICGRRSLFTLPNQQCLLVNEIFLPSMKAMMTP